MSRLFSPPLVSILIVAHNPGEYLRNTLLSCLEQTYQNTEILILDNASKEKIGERITGLQDYRITENHNESSFLLCKTNNLSDCKTVRLYRSDTNLGPYGGLNFLLEKAHGAYIAIQDHDDIWHEKKLEKQISFLEEHQEYIGCGTKTIMYYEGDAKYFEYFLGKENYYTIHPSLLFRITKNEKGKMKKQFRYDTSRDYMCDAYSLKYHLCGGKKCIANLDESLTLHLIKKGSTNYSYRWFKMSRETLSQLYHLHSIRYATQVLIWESMRKIIYPILQTLGLGRWIDPIERIPFRMMGNRIEAVKGDEWWKERIQPPRDLNQKERVGSLLAKQSK